MTVDTLIRAEADATAERDRVLGMRSIRRDRVLLRARMDTVTPVADLGDEVKVVYTRYGYNAGKSFRVIGQRLDAAARMLTLELWG
jgi:hypothetical protein